MTVDRKSTRSAQLNGSLRPLQTRNVRHQVRDQLREAILSGQFRPGDRIIESVVAERLGVSITPVREALRELESSRLVVSQPHRGTVVRDLSRQDIWEMYTLRAHLERLSIRLALPHLTDADFEHLAQLIDEMIALARRNQAAEMVEVDVDFHGYICRKSGHKLLYDMWSGVNPSNWTMITVRRLAKRGPLYIAERHLPLLGILKSGDSARAEEAMEAHILAVGDEVLAEWSGEEPAQSHEEAPS